MKRDFKYYYRKYSKCPKWRAAKRAYMRKWYKDNRQTWLNYKRKDNYGPGSVEHFEKQKKKQKGRCAVCRRIMTKPNQDHNHATDKLRGVLCNWCNTGLAFLENNKWMKKAKGYLQVWK
jgi:Recombination endonuclease VII